MGMIATDINKATRSAIGLLKLTGKAAARSRGDSGAAAGGLTGSAAGVSSTTTGSEVGLPQRWQNVAPSTSWVPQVQNSGMNWLFQFDIEWPALSGRPIPRGDSG